MSTVAFIRRLLAAGFDLDAALTAAEALEAERVSVEFEPTPRQARNRRYYETKRLKASENRLNPSEREGAGEASESVLKRLKASEIKTPSCARLENNPLDKGLSSAAALGASADSDNWPEGGLMAWRDALVMLAGPGLADPAKSPGLVTTVAEIDRWRLMGCSWGQDVVPTIQGRTLKPRPNSPIGSWNLFTRDVLATKARRQAQVEAPNVIQLQATGPPSNVAAAMREEGRRRALAQYEADG